MLVKKYLSELRLISRPLLGLFFSQIFASLLNTTDILIAGSVSHIDLAGVSIATSIYMPVMLFFGGLVMVSPLVSHRMGSKEPEKVSHILRHSLVMAWVFSGIAIIILTTCSIFLFDYLNLEADVANLAKKFLLILMLGMPAVLGYFVVRALFEGSLKSAPILVSSIVVFFANIIFSLIFAKGWLGFPAMGGLGCAIATICCQYVWAGILIFYYLKDKNLNKLNIFDFTNFKLNFSEFKEIIFITLPFALGIFFESSYFNATILMASRFSTETIAGHQILLNMGSILFMIPMSIGIVIANRMSFKIGARRFYDLKRTMISAYMMMIFFYILVSVVIVGFGKDLVNLYNSNQKVLSVALALLPMLLLNFFFDSLQNVSAGMIRGFGKTSYILWVSFFVYLFIGGSGSYFISQYTGSAVGIWWGMVIGFGVAFGIFLVMNIRLYKKLLKGRFG